MTIVLELYDVVGSVADINYLKRSVAESLGNRVITSFVVPKGNSARIAVIRDDEIPIIVLEELKKIGIDAKFVLRSPIIGISESPEFVREVLRAHDSIGLEGVSSIVGDLSEEKIIEKVGQVLRLEEIEKLKDTPKASIDKEIKPVEARKARLIRADASEERFDPDKIIDTLVEAGIGSKIAKEVVGILSALIDSDFYIDYEVSWGIKKSLLRTGEYEDIKRYEGYIEYPSRVYIDGIRYSSARLMEIIRSSIDSELKPSATLLRQLRDHIVRLIRALSAESSTTIHLEESKIRSLVKLILEAQIPYINSKKPWEEAYEEAKRDLMISKHFLDVDRGEAIRLLESSIEHALRSICLSKLIIPPFGIEKILPLVREDLGEAMIKRLKMLKDAKDPANRYNPRIINTLIDAAENLIRIAFEKMPERS